MDYEEKVSINRSVIEVESGMIFYFRDRYPNSKSGEFNKHFYLALGEPNENGYVSCLSFTSGKTKPVETRYFLPVTILDSQKSYLSLEELHSIHKSNFINQNYRSIIKRCDILPRDEFMKFVFNMFLYLNGLPTMVPEYILNMLYDEYIEAYNIKYSDNFDMSNSEIIFKSANSESKRLTYSPFSNIDKIVGNVSEKKEDNKVVTKSKNNTKIVTTKKKKGEKKRKHQAMEMSSSNIEKWTDKEILQYIDLKERKTTKELMDLFGYAKGTIYSMNWKTQKEAIARDLFNTSK